MTLRSGEFSMTMENGYILHVCPQALGCSMYGNGDLYDHGFKEKDHVLQVLDDSGRVVISFPKESKS